VIRQLDGLKDSDKPKVRWNSRQASNIIDKTSPNILKQKEFIKDLGNQADNEIIGAAVRLKKEHPGERIILFSTDTNMRIVAGTYGIEPVNPFELNPDPIEKEEVAVKEPQKNRFSIGLPLLMTAGPALIVASSIAPFSAGTPLMWLSVTAALFATVAYMFHGNFSHSSQGAHNMGLESEDYSHPSPDVLDPGEPINWILYEDRD
jgi:hypothetical protein